MNPLAQFVNDGMYLTTCDQNCVKNSIEKAIESAGEMGEKENGIELDNEIIRNI